MTGEENLHMTKADYDELVRLRDAGCIFAFCNGKGHRFGTSDYPMNPECPTISLRSVFRGASKNTLLFIDECEVIEIAAAIVEYERAQEGKSGTD
jgi:hypothetical protein